MATLQGMSGLDLRALACELKEMLPLWIGKVYQFDPRTFGIRLNGENRAKYQFIIETGRRAHIVDSFPVPPKNPPSFAMLLRKYLEGGRVLDIRQIGLERVIVFDVGRRDTTYHLFIELFDEGNAILTDAELTIIKPLWHHRFKNREVIPGVRYEFSGTDCSQMTYEAFQELLQSSDRDLVRTLATGCMLGGQYAEEVCRTAGIDKDTPAASADADPVYRALRRLLERVEHEREPFISKTGCWPIRIGEQEAITSFETFNLALEAFYPKVEKEVEKAEKPRLTQQEVIRKRQLDALSGFEKKIEKSERAVAAIYEHYGTVADIITTLDRASRERSWQEIDQILKANDHPAGKIIRAVHPADAAVELDLGNERVKIYVHETVEQNVQRYYDQVKKFKKKKTGAIAAMERAIVSKAPRKQQLAAQKKRWFHRFRWFYTSDGVLVLGGRDASQNEELVKKYMEGGDTFVHADVHGGSIVIVKGKTAHMDEAARFAASYSNAWKAGHFTADVYSARPDQVSKTPESGEYVARGAFIVRGERTYYRNVPLGVAIGIRCAPDVAVVGGPTSVIAGQAKVRVELRPGLFEPNDTAKKVLRLLKDRLSDDVLKDFKNVLNTEQVAAFVPPGGSDIVEEHEG
jgi:predicted ribosome quality control (RQC) complex YloA/Tae2 family protein